MTRLYHSSAITYKRNHLITIVHGITLVHDKTTLELISPLFMAYHNCEQETRLTEDATEEMHGSTQLNGTSQCSQQRTLAELPTTDDQRVVLTEKQLKRNSEELRRDVTNVTKLKQSVAYKRNSG